MSGRRRGKGGTTTTTTTTTTTSTASISICTSRESLQSLLGAKNKAILCFHAGWLRGSRVMVESVARQLQQVEGGGGGGGGWQNGGDGASSSELILGSLDVGEYEDLAFEEEVGLLPYFNFYREGRRVKGATVRDLGKAVELCRAFAISMDEDDIEEENNNTHPSTTHLPPRPQRFPLIDRIPPSKPLLLFIAGDRSKVGKSSIALALLGALLHLGFSPSDLAYIKPATQCEAPQLVTKFCDTHGIANEGIGPVVFYKGFTRAFLNNEMGTSADLLHDACQGVYNISKHKKFILVDGVGYPAVGSICGLSNADIAEALKCPVLIVGRPGVGDAVDSFNLNAAFFRVKGVKVLGALFNRLPLEGFYSLENCREAVTKYFTSFQPHTHIYGFLPEVPSLGNVREEIDLEHTNKQTLEAAKEAQRMATAHTLIHTFETYIDIRQLVKDVFEHWMGEGSAGEVEVGVGVGIGGTALPVGGVAVCPFPSSSVPPPPPPAQAPGPALAAVAITGGGGGGGGGEGACAWVPPSKRKAQQQEEEEEAAAAAAVAADTDDGGGGGGTCGWVPGRKKKAMEEAETHTDTHKDDDNGGGGGGGMCAFVPGRKRKTREEIEQAAKKQGAKGG